MRITVGKKEEYKEKNLRFLEEVATGEGVVRLPCGVLYKEIEKGTGVVSPELTDVFPSITVERWPTDASSIIPGNGDVRSIPPQSGDRRMAGSTPADACGRPLDDLYPVYIRLRDTYIRSDPRLFHTAVRSRTVGDCIIFLKALFQFPIDIYECRDEEEVCCYPAVGSPKQTAKNPNIGTA